MRWMTSLCFNFPLMHEGLVLNLNNWKTVSIHWHQLMESNIVVLSWPFANFCIHHIMIKTAEVGHKEIFILHLFISIIVTCSKLF